MNAKKALTTVLSIVIAGEAFADFASRSGLGLPVLIALSVSIGFYVRYSRQQKQ